MHFCSIKNVAVVRCIFLEMHFVVIIMVIISYVLKKEQERCHRWCENTKGGREPKTVEKHCIRKYGPLLNATFSKWPPTQINCPPLTYNNAYRIKHYIVTYPSQKSTFSATTG